MDSSGTGSGPWTRGMKRIVEEVKKREEEKKQMKKRQQKLFGPRLIPSAASNSSGPSGKSILIGTNDIVVNPNIPKIQLPENFELKPEIKEDAMEVDHSTGSSNAGFQIPTLTTVKNEIDSEDEVDSTGQEAAGVDETEEMTNQLHSDSDQVALELSVREENALQIPENFEVISEIKEEMEVEHSTIVVLQDNYIVPVTNEIGLEDDVGGLDQQAVGVEESEEIIDQLNSDQVAVAVERSVSEENALVILDLEKKLKEKDLRIRELELELGSEKQRIKQLSRELAFAKGAATFYKNGVMNAINEDDMKTMVRAIMSGKSKQQFQSLVENFNRNNSQGDTFLHAAARAGILELVTCLISIGHGVNARNVYGSTPLMEAARANENFLEVADLLIRSGADLKATNNAGENALFIAVEAGKTLGQIRTLCFEDCLKVKCSRRGDTVLHRAAMSGNLEVLEHFVSLEPDVNVKNYYGLTPLMSAAYFANRNFSAIMNFLLRNGADANDGVGVIEKAIRSRKYRIPMSEIKELIDAGAGWEKDSILYGCIEMGHNEALKYFAANGANLDDRMCQEKRYSCPPLTYAAKLGNIEAMVSLLDNGATNFNGYKNIQNDRFLSRATMEVLDKLSKVRDIWDGSMLHGFAKNGNLEGVRWCVLKKGADVNLKDHERKAPIFLAATAEKPNWELLDFFIEFGANVNTVNSQGFNALHVATKRGRSLEVLETLITRYGAIWSKGVVGRWDIRESILHAAICGGFPEVVEYFISRGVGVNCRDFKGDTPLIQAVKLAKKNFPEMLRVLVNGGADPNVKDSYGNSALLLGVRQVEYDNTLLTLEQLEVLVALGCDWRAPNADEETVLSKLEGSSGRNAEVLEYFKRLH